MQIYIWGTGRLVGKVVGRYIAIDNIAGFIDNDRTKTEYMGKPVCSPEEMLNKEYDAICVANLYAREIYKQCQHIGIRLDRVIFLYNNCDLQDMNEDYQFVETVLGKEYAEIVKRRYHVVRGMEAYGDLFLEAEKGTYYDTDYVRIKSFELAVKEIRKRRLVGTVLGRMRHLDNIVIKQGYFPESLNGL